MSDHAQGEEDQRDRRSAKLGTSVVAPTWMPSPRTPLSLGICTVVTLGLRGHTRTRPKTGSPALLSAKPWAHRCAPANREGVSPSHLILTLQDVGSGWSLYSLILIQLRSGEEPHHSRGALSLWTGEEHTQTSLCFVSGGL